MDNQTLSDIVRKYLLVNAAEHGGVAQPKSAMGRILADMPELRPRVLEIRSMAEKEAESINRMPIGDQKTELERMGGYSAERRAEKKGLPDLELTRDRVVLRFAPNPDGAIHLGNARPAILCDEYAKRYKGKLILRFDDTDPKVKVPEAKFYKWIKDDLKWLRVKWDSEAVASRRLNIYCKIAGELILKGGAYVCTCGEGWKKLCANSRPCKCRGDDVKTVMKKWRNMMKHKYKEGEAVLRVKTDLEAKNPAVRDWPAFRIVDKPRHPLKKAHLWPLYNFASGVDDHLLGVTHIFRGQEHSTNEVKQRYLFQYFRWEYPMTITLGRFSLSDMVLSKSTIREGIRKHQFNGWDDPRLGTIRGLRRRGFQPETLRQIIIDVGPKPSDITISAENLASYNRKIIDKTAHRYFFIQNAKKIEVSGLKIKSANLAYHPDSPKKGRKFKLGRHFLIDANDFESYKGLEVRLKDLCNIKLGEKSVYTGNELKSIPKIHWLPERHITVRVTMPNEVLKGYGETNLAKTKKGDIIQFERFAFVRIEKVSPSAISVIFLHK
ncbi:MAG: glutamate--tRNA ligase [Candidatus Aenigmarchaeota archaeon]|nr:glutamate--tRNA ligase [Candidatus Aenigmarchaeota archaeon]